MRWQTTAALAVLLAILGAGYYVYEIRQGPEREKAEARKGRVLTADLADVTEMEIKRPGDTVRVTREGDGWRMLAPVQARAARGPVEETITTVTTAKMDREISASPANLGEFGLDQPAADVTLTLKDGKRVGLTLGGKNPTGVWVYAREHDKPAVVVVGETTLRDSTRPASDFRDKTVLAFDRKDVTGVDITLPDTTMTVELADGRWKMTKPAGLTADTDTLGEFFDKIMGAQVKEFVAEAPQSLAPYGLDRPARVAIHTGKDKERSTKALLFGRVDEAKKGVYAMRPGETSVLLLPDPVWTAVPKNVAALRDRTVVAFERDKVTRLDVESPRGKVTAVRENDKWKLTAPEALPADSVEVGAILFKLREMKAQGFLSDDASGIPKYLGKPEVRVTLTDAGGQAQTLLLAPSPEKRGGQPTAYAGIAGKGPVVLVDGKALAELGRSVNELRDRTLIAGLEPRDVKRVRLKSGGKTLVLERKSDTEWRTVEPTKGAAKSGRVDELLFTLRGLKWKDLAAPTGAEPAKYGLDAPALEATLYSDGGKEIATIAIGRRDGAVTYVKTGAAPAVYAVDTRALGEPPKIPDDFQS
ncbi:MAG: DUF4340 domain-containing protein, partial [Candidatus Rokubacteria bacterium]|nr:DUF4340 domain-containing protein [Candidatus Rokubacteria bacterium]